MWVFDHIDVVKTEPRSGGEALGPAIDFNLHLKLLVVTGRIRSQVQVAEDRLLWRVSQKQKLRTSTFIRRLRLSLNGQHGEYLAISHRRE